MLDTVTRQMHKLTIICRLWNWGENVLCQTAYLIRYVLPVSGRTKPGQRVSQSLSHVLDPAVYGHQVLSPLRLDVCVVPHGGDDTCSKRHAGGHFGPDDEHQLGLGSRHDSRVGYEEMEGPDALAVQAHVLTE